jgi:hypothetical protein
MTFINALNCSIRELRDGELHFGGYHRPEWPSNDPT